MTARVHLLVGAGGVGKTTLAAGYALALARDGARVGLLGSDPSRRLADALGTSLGDAPAAIPGAPTLRAAITLPHRAIARWIDEACAPADRGRLAANAFFAALGDRLASATDLLAAVRIAEWLETDSLDDLVVDTAPGIAALDLLRAPRELAALVHARVLRWLLARRESRVLRAFRGLAGGRLVGELAEFFALVRAPLAQLVDRAAAAQRDLARAEILLVTSPHDTGAAGAAQLHAALAREQLAPRAVIVNRTLPLVPGELAALPSTPLVSYARAELAAQAGVLAAARTLGPVIALPSIHLSPTALAALGAQLAVRLSPALVTRSAS